MKYVCSHCGYENNEESKFCYKCGVPITFQKKIANDSLNDNKDLHTERSLNSDINEFINNNNFDMLWKKEEKEDVTLKEEHSRIFYSSNEINDEIKEEKIENKVQDNKEAIDSTSQIDSSVSTLSDSNVVFNEKESVETKEVEENQVKENSLIEAEEGIMSKKRQFIINNKGIFQRQFIIPLVAWSICLITVILAYFIPFLSNSLSNVINIQIDFSLFDSTKKFIESIKYFIENKQNFNVLIRYQKDFYGLIILMVISIYLLVIAILSIVKIIKYILKLQDIMCHGLNLYYKALGKNNYNSIIFISIGFLLNIILFAILPFLSKIEGVDEILLLNGYSISIIYIAIPFAILIGLFVFDITSFASLKKKIQSMENTINLEVGNNYEER